MKLEISVSEAVEIFKEIQETPEKLFDMIREFKRRTKPMEIVAGENACYTLLTFICLKMEMHRKKNPIEKVRPNLPFFKKLTSNVIS
jgi:hypothetical protein